MAAAGLGIAAVAAVDAAIVATAGEAVVSAAVAAEGVPLLEPQALTITLKTRAAAASQRGLLGDMRSASLRESPPGSDGEAVAGAAARRQ